MPQRSLGRARAGCGRRGQAPAATRRRVFKRAGVVTASTVTPSRQSDGVRFVACERGPRPKCSPRGAAEPDLTKQIDGSCDVAGQIGSCCWAYVSKRSIIMVRAALVLATVIGALAPAARNGDVNGQA